MPRQPTLETWRLLLRPFRMADADEVQRLAGNRAVAATTLNVPHPYEGGMAEKWIANHRDWFEANEQTVFAITFKPGGSAGSLVGSIGLRITAQDQRAELGYWIGEPHWNQGYCTEAAAAVIRFGFEQLDLNRICARHFARNPASGRVMQKIGMAHEGHLRQHVKKWDKFEDLELFGVLKCQWAANVDRRPL